MAIDDDDDFEDDDEIGLFEDYEEGEIGTIRFCRRTGSSAPARCGASFRGMLGPRPLQRLRRRDRGGPPGRLTGPGGGGERLPPIPIRQRKIAMHRAWNGKPFIIRSGTTPGRSRTATAASRASPAASSHNGEEGASPVPATTAGLDQPPAESLIRQMGWRQKHADEMSDLPTGTRSIAATWARATFRGAIGRRCAARASGASPAGRGLKAMFGTYCRLGVPVWSTDREGDPGGPAPAPGDGALRSARSAPAPRLLPADAGFHHCEQELVREYRL